MWQFEADVDNGKPNLAVAQDGIGDPIFELDNLGSSTKHNGGHIHFGADGKPYIPVGDNKRGVADRARAKIAPRMGRKLLSILCTYP